MIITIKKNKIMMRMTMKMLFKMDISEHDDSVDACLQNIKTKTRAGEMVGRPGIFPGDHSPRGPHWAHREGIFFF